jgi:hypothetical protein
MMLFRLLKLFGIDVPAHVAQLQAKLERRVEVAKDQVRRAAQTAAVVAALSALGAVAMLAAAGVGLFALYSWVLLNYGLFYALAAVGGVLILIAIILFAGAMLEARSWSAEGEALDAVPAPPAVDPMAVSPAAAAALDEVPAAAQASPTAHPATSAADLVAPLSLIFSRFMKFPTTGNPVLDELLFVLRGSAKGAADEAVDGVVQTVRYGDRAKLVAVLGTAVLVGWLLARHHQGQVRSPD